MTQDSQVNTDKISESVLNVLFLTIMLSVDFVRMGKISSILRLLKVLHYYGVIEIVLIINVSDLVFVNNLIKLLFYES